MTTPIAITLILATLTALLGAPMIGAYLYFRGTTRANPLPARIDNLINPKPKPTPEPLPPAPPFPCPHCTKDAGYTLSVDWRSWVCNDCKKIIPGPKARLGA